VDWATGCAERVDCATGCCEAERLRGVAVCGAGAAGGGGSGAATDDGFCVRAGRARGVAVWAGAAYGATGAAYGATGAGAGVLRGRRLGAAGALAGSVCTRGAAPRDQLADTRLWSSTAGACPRPAAPPKGDAVRSPPRVGGAGSAAGSRRLVRETDAAETER